MPIVSNILYDITFLIVCCCTAYKGIVNDAFLLLQGLDKTMNSNFGGGNTKWEEKSLGKWKTR